MAALLSFPRDRRAPPSRRIFVEPVRANSFSNQCIKSLNGPRQSQPGVNLSGKGCRALLSFKPFDLSRSLVNEGVRRLAAR